VLVSIIKIIGEVYYGELSTQLLAILFVMFILKI